MKHSVKLLVLALIFCFYLSYALSGSQRVVSCSCANQYCDCKAGPCPAGYTASCDCTGFTSPGGGQDDMDCRCGCYKETPPQIQPPDRGPGKMIFERLTMPETWKDAARMLSQSIDLKGNERLSDYLACFGVAVTPTKSGAVDNLSRDGKTLLMILREVSKETKQDIHFFGIRISSQAGMIPEGKPVVRIQSPGISPSLFYCLMLCRYDISFDFLLDPAVSDKLLVIDAQGITLEEFQRDLMVGLYNN